MSYKQASLELIFSNTTPLANNVITIDSSRFYEVLDEFEKCTRFGLDTETFSCKEIDTAGKRSKKFANQSQDIEALDAFLGYIRLIQIGLDSGNALVIDLGGKADKNYPYSLERLAKFLKVLEGKLLDNNTEVIGHNLLFDLKYLLQHLGYRANNCFDTMLASQIYWSGVGVAKVGKGESRKDRCKLPHTLLAVCDRLDIEIDKTEQLSDWSWYLTNKQLNYAANDALIVLKVRDTLVSRISAKIPELLYSIQAENLALPVFAEMEYLGFTINESRLLEALDKYQEEISRLTNYWNSCSPTVTWTQAKELPALFRELLDISIESADSATLAEFCHFPLIETLLDLRTLNISLNYLTAIKNNAFVNNGRYVVNSHKETVSIRTKFRQIATNWRSASGKDDDLSKFKAADEINLQQAPKLRKKHEARGLPNVKSVFTPPEGYSLLVADLSQCVNENCKVPVKGRGLISIKDVEVGDYVYGYKEGQVVLSEVKKKHNYNYSGLMYDFKAKYLKQRITANHHLYLKDDSYLPIEEVIGKKRWSDLVCKAAPLNRNDYPVSDAEIKLAIAVAADGTYSQNPECKRPGLKFHFHKERKVDRLNQILAELGYTLEWFEKYNTSYNCTEYSLNKIPLELKERVHELVPNKILPSWLLELSARQRNIAINELINWDGSNITKEGANYNSYQFCSYKEQEIQLVQELLLQSGIRSNLVKNGTVITFNNRECYGDTSKPYMNVIRNRPQRIIYDEVYVENEPVACLTTETSNFYYLTEKGSLELTGNCHARIAAQMSQDATMIAAYRDGLDNHLVMAQRILEGQGYTYSYEELVKIHKAYKAKTKNHEVISDIEGKVAETRDHAKTAFYAFLNQSGAYTLQQSFKKDGIFLDIEQCQEFINILRHVYRGLYSFIKEEMGKANNYNVNIKQFNYLDVNGKLLEGNYGIVRGLCGSRNLALKSKQMKDGKIVKESTEQIAYTDSISFMWLSSEKSMIATTMGKLRLLFQQYPNWEANIINFAHDEMNIICNSEYARDVANLVGLITKEELSKWITSFPVEENDHYESMIVEDWSKK